MKITKVDALAEKARKIRIDLLQEVYYGKSGHIGSSLSCADILAVLYFNEMNIDPQDPKAESRDRFVLSKGHASEALYATLAERGYFPKEDLITFRHIDSPLQGHPDMNKVPGVDMTTGSLGQGLSAANGMAIASKIDKQGFRVYCLMGDGELEEGQVWEAAMTSSQYELDNICAIIDCNGLQLTGKTEEIKSLNHESIEQKFRSFGFNTIVIDGMVGKPSPTAIWKLLTAQSVLISAHSSVRECSRFRPCISAPLLTRWKSGESKPFSEISTGIFVQPTA